MVAQLCDLARELINVLAFAYKSEAVKILKFIFLYLPLIAATGQNQRKKNFIAVRMAQCKFDKYLFVSLNNSRNLNRFIFGSEGHNVYLLPY